VAPWWRCGSFMVGEGSVVRYAWSGKCLHGGLEVGLLCGGHEHEEAI